jgi:SAM-dependent methyltransferase
VNTASGSTRAETGIGRPDPGGISSTCCNLCRTPVPSHAEPRWRKDGFDIIQCPTCGLIFRRGIPTPAEIGEIYGPELFKAADVRRAAGYSDYLADEPEHRLTARRRLGRLPSVTEGGRLLDVGCAAGFFVAEARELGWDAAGIDVSPQMSQWGRERLGLPITSGLFQEAEYAEASFDLVTMWDYIEHSCDPSADFAKAHSILRPGGRLILATGDAGSLVARVSGRRWHLLNPRYHNFYFTVKTLRAYLDRCGFRVAEVSRPAAVYSVGYVTFKARSMAPRSRTVRALGDLVRRTRIGEVTVPLNLWDIVTVEAVKEAPA